LCLLAILNPDCYDLWLDPGFPDVVAAGRDVEALRRERHAGLPGESRVSNVAK